MASYSYPRPPTLTSHPKRRPTQTANDKRFSWMDTPADAEALVFGSNTRREDAVPPPPLPQHSEESEKMDGHGAYSLQNMHPGPGPHPALYGLGQSQSPAPEYQRDPAAPQPQAAAPPPLQQDEDLTIKKDIKRLHVPIPTIAPDENPLSPTTPSQNYFLSGSTNISSVPPTNPSAYSVAAFMPTPQPAQGGTWRHSLCSCAEPSICLTAVFCPCIIYGRAAHRLSLREAKKDPTNMLGYSTVNGSCLAFGVLCGINGILAAIQRTRVRKAYGMDAEAGNIPGDCIRGCCCCCCVVAQNETELKSREEEARKPRKDEGYVAPRGMNYHAPPR